MTFDEWWNSKLRFKIHKQIAKHAWDQSALEEAREIYKKIKPAQGELAAISILSKLMLFIESRHPELRENPRAERAKDGETDG